MKKRKEHFNCILNFWNDEKGSTIITVLIAVFFITVLATVVLGSSIMNIRMRGIDRMTKDDFYSAEKALNDIYTGIGQNMQQIAANSYQRAFADTGASGSYSTGEGAMKRYKADFVLGVGKYFYIPGSDPKQELVNLFNTYITTDPTKTSIKIGKDTEVITDLLKCKILGVTNEKKYNDEFALASLNSYDSKDSSTQTEGDKFLKIRLKDVTVTVKDDNDYQSSITTDIVVGIPTTSFLSTSADTTDFAIVANKGVKIEGDTEVYGSMYAGTAAVDSLDGGIAVNSGTVKLTGENIVTRGDINVKEGATLQFANSSTTSNPYAGVEPNVWFESMRTVKGTGSAGATIKTDAGQKANIFAFNDLELNANNSDISLAGSYYGYNEGSLGDVDGDGSIETTIEHQSVGHEHSDNSAIVINGSNSKLDLGGLDTFLLMGRAYIDNKSFVDTANDIATVEGLAVKTNQQLYLFPNEFLKGSNPCEGEGASVFEVNVTNPDDWFGYKYVKKQVGGIEVFAPIVKTVSKGGKKISYAYLEFNDGYFDSTFNRVGTKGVDTPLGNWMSAETAYLAEILQGAETTGELQPSALTLKKKMGKSASSDFFKLQDVIVDNAGTPDQNLYFKNAVARYESSTKQFTNVANTGGYGQYGLYQGLLFKRFQWLCSCLDAKEDVALFDMIPDSLGAKIWKHDSPYENYPLDSIIFMSEIPAGYNNSSASTPDTLNDEDHYGKVVVVDGSCSISGDFKGSVIATGDIELASNATVTGMILSGGVITFKGHNKVTMDQSILQKRIEKEMEYIKKGTTSTYPDDFLIKYLRKSHETNGEASTELAYVVTPQGDTMKDEFNMDYNEFVYFENWRKGEKD